MAKDPDFKPNTFDDVFKVWASKGLISFDLIKSNLWRQRDGDI